MAGETIEVEWVGGPEDGQRFQMRRSKVVQWAETSGTFNASDPEASDWEMRQMEAPVRLTRNGYRAYWEERR